MLVRDALFIVVVHVHPQGETKNGRVLKIEGKFKVHPLTPSTGE